MFDVLWTLVPVCSFAVFRCHRVWPLKGSSLLSFQLFSRLWLVLCLLLSRKPNTATISLSLSGNQHDTFVGVCFHPKRMKVCSLYFMITMSFLDFSHVFGNWIVWELSLYHLGCFSRYGCNCLILVLSHFSVWFLIPVYHVRNRISMNPIYIRRCYKECGTISSFVICWCNCFNNERT